MFQQQGDYYRSLSITLSYQDSGVRRFRFIFAENILIIITILKIRNTKCLPDVTLDCSVLIQPVVVELDLPVHLGLLLGLIRIGFPGDQPHVSTETENSKN